MRKKDGLWSSNILCKSNLFRFSNQLGKCKSILTKNVKKAEDYFEDYFKVGENICKNESGFEAYKFQKYLYNFNDSYSFKVIGKKITVSRKIDAQTYFSKTISSSPSYATSVYGDGLKEVYHLMI